MAPVELPKTNQTTSWNTTGESFQNATVGDNFDAVIRKSGDGGGDGAGGGGRSGGTGVVAGGGGTAHSGAPSSIANRSNVLGNVALGLAIDTALGNPVLKTVKKIGRAIGG